MVLSDLPHPPSRQGGPTSDRSADVEQEDFLFHLYRGSELLQDNRIMEAKGELESALKLSPRDAKGQDLLAVVYFRLGLYPRAIAIYEELRKSAPRDPSLKLNLALCYLKTGQNGAARTELEELTELAPSHTRAWGYLGLVYERAGDIERAEQAFERGGHPLMARRMADRRGARQQDTRSQDGSSQALRAVAGAAFEELDAGELSFALAEPSADNAGGLDASWQSVELGQSGAPPATRAPTTKDGPGAMTPASMPVLGQAQGPQERRPTLMAPDPRRGADDNARSEFPADATMPSAESPFLGMQPRVASPVAVVKGSPELPLSRNVSIRPPVQRQHDSDPAPPTATPRDLIDRPFPAAALRPATPPPPPAPDPPPVPERLASERPEPVDNTLRLLDETAGYVWLRPRPGAASFAARLSAVRAMTSGLFGSLIERRTRARGTNEPMGGIGSPLGELKGEGEVYFGSRPGHTLVARTIESDVWFLREDNLVAFDLELAFENGRLGATEGESISFVQLRGHGSVLIESNRPMVTLPVRERSLLVRREAVIGWIGRLVPRALAPAESPAGQRGLFVFAGEGQVIFTP
jgi:hypothetical protein